MNRRRFLTRCAPVILACWFPWCCCPKPERPRPEFPRRRRGEREERERRQRASG